MDIEITDYVPGKLLILNSIRTGRLSGYDSDPRKEKSHFFYNGAKRKFFSSIFGRKIFKITP